MPLWKMKGHIEHVGPLHMVFCWILRHCHDVLDSLILVVTGETQDPGTMYVLFYTLHVKTMDSAMGIKAYIQPDEHT